MLDWFSGYVGYDASQLDLGRVLEFDRHGEVVRHRDRWETARGSHEAGVQVTRGSATESMLESAATLGFHCAPQVFRVSGNPAKFLQGHNAAGPSVSLLGPVLQGLFRAFGEGFRPGDADADALPAVQRSRLDVTTAVDLGTHEDVHDWLTRAATLTRSRHGRAIDSAGTVYWGKTSTRWSLKAYCKHCELLAHPPPAIDLRADLLEWTRTHLRIELTLRRPELKHRGTLDESIIWEYFARVETGAMAPKKRPLEGLRAATKLSLLAWYEGTELACILPRATLYRHRREILDVTGIDVMLPRTDQAPGARSTLLGLDDLMRLEVKNVPERIQRSLFGACS